MRETGRRSGRPSPYAVRSGWRCVALIGFAAGMARPFPAGGPGRISRPAREGASSGRERRRGIVISPRIPWEVIMNGRILKVLTVIAGILAVGEFGSSVVIWKENYPGSLPM